MSAPSSSPSPASSHTLHSRTRDASVSVANDNDNDNDSANDNNHGEGSSSPLPRHRPVSQGSGSGSSRLAPEAIEEVDFAHHHHQQRSTARPARRSGGGFLLGSAFPSGPPAKSRHEEQPPSRLRVPKARTSTSTSTSATAVDPNQLVHMALTLSETRRRRNMTASPLLDSQHTPNPNANPTAATTSSLRQYLNDQRRVSRNISPMGKASPSRHMSMSVSSPSANTLNPSPATLARRDKARAYIELRAEYMRLLQFLPPLKDDANAPGNYTYTANAVPGSPHAYLTRTPSYAGNKHALGRPYNPLQALRNRRSRARERLTLPHDPAAFSDTDRVHDWIDVVEAHSKTPQYRQEDRVALPHLLHHHHHGHGHGHGHTHTHHHSHDQQAAPTKPSKTHQGWAFTPEELLADAYWLEHGNNKSIIEDRHGHNIFPPRDPPKQHKLDLLAPRSSKDSSRRRSWVDAVAATDPATGDESEQGSDRGRKRRLLPKIRADSRLRTGRISPRKHSPDHSDSSDTDHDVRKTRHSLDVEHNTGPLALQIKRRLELQTHGLGPNNNNKSPALDTPDTPDKWGRTQHDGLDGKTLRTSLDAPRLANGGSATNIDENATLKMPPRNRTNPLTPIKSAEPRSSLEDDSTAPTTPLHVRHFPHIGSDMSPPPSRDGSDRGKTKRSKLNPFHATHQDHDKHEQKHAQDPADLDKVHAPRHTVHRNNGSLSSLDSPDKPRRKGLQDPHSAVTRFFKGVKHEGTKVGDIIFRRDRADDTDASTVSDRNSVEFDDNVDEMRKPGLSRTVTSTTTASLTSDKEGQSRLKLPTFRPVHEALSDDDDASDLEHHISRQSRQRRNERSPRIDRLLPPRMDLERVSTASSTATLGPMRSLEQDPVKKQLARPGGVMAYPNNLPPTSLKDAQKRHRSASRPTLDGKRHWSIADGDDNTHALQQRQKRNAVSQADIARVRALFLCSGVKAKEIVRRANAHCEPAPRFLTRAAETANQPLIPVSRKEEHILAARILVTDLERCTAALHRACEAFRTGAIKDLNARINALREGIETDLMPRVFECGDCAVRVTGDVSGQGPLQVKQINDEIDRMLRQRRRHSRWVMSWGWSAVEWGIVVALRLASIVFAAYGLLKCSVLLLWGVLRWLLWL